MATIYETVLEEARQLSPEEQRRLRDALGLAEQSRPLVQEAISASITLRDLAVRLRGLPFPGDGFADDLEAIQSAQPQARLPEWLS